MTSGAVVNRVRIQERKAGYQPIPLGEVALRTIPRIGEFIHFYADDEDHSLKVVGVDHLIEASGEAVIILLTGIRES
jgi:hypothetical protein